MNLLAHYNHWIAVALMMLGLWTTIESHNLVKKLIGVSVLQTSVFVLYLSFGRTDGGAAPILAEGREAYSNPLPQVLILTAIVVGIATTSLGLALAMRIGGAFGTVEDDLLDDNSPHDQDDAEARP